MTENGMLENTFIISFKATFRNMNWGNFYYYFVDHIFATVMIVREFSD